METAAASLLGFGLWPMALQGKAASRNALCMSPSGSTSRIMLTCIQCPSVVYYVHDSVLTERETTPISTPTQVAWHRMCAIRITIF